MPVSLCFKTTSFEEILLDFISAFNSALKSEISVSIFSSNLLSASILSDFSKARLSSIFLFNSVFTLFISVFTLFISVTTFPLKVVIDSFISALTLFISVTTFPLKVVIYSFIVSSILTVYIPSLSTERYFSPPLILIWATWSMILIPSPNSASIKKFSKSIPTNLSSPFSSL